jgi:hypothetical protein
MPQNSTNNIKNQESRLDVLGGLFFSTSEVLDMLKTGLISKDAAAKYLGIPQTARV